MEYQLQFQGTTNSNYLPCNKVKNKETVTSGSKGIEKPVSYNVFSEKKYSVKNARITKVTYVRK